jgi:uncharacterized protein involved in response to NO
MEPPRMTGSATADISRMPRLLAAAPHRALFLGGATAVLLAMGWWTSWLVTAVVAPGVMPAPELPAGWAHALGMQYQVLPLFFFGFLLTVYPRWMGLEPYRPVHFVPIAVLLASGYLLFHLGLLGLPVLLHAGWAGTLAGFALGLALLFRLIWRNGARDLHAVAIWIALSLGLVGLVLAARYLHGGDARLVFGAIKLGTFGLLLPVYITVCHRMIPFFSNNVIPGYRPWRPTWLLVTLLTLVFAHGLLELAHAYTWLFPLDATIAALAGYTSWRWGLIAARRNRLLLVLHWGFAWLAVAFTLYAAQSVWFALTGDFVFGRAPNHVLAIGFFGSLLLAMVTRVTQGHSGRPLEMGRVPWLAFLTLQAAVLVRVAAEMLPNQPLWLAVAALGWMLAFVPWVIRSAWIWTTPRVDGKPG